MPLKCTDCRQSMTTTLHGCWTTRRPSSTCWESRWSRWPCGGRRGRRSWPRLWSASMNLLRRPSLCWSWIRGMELCHLPSTSSNIDCSPSCPTPPPPTPSPLSLPLLSLFISFTVSLSLPALFFWGGGGGEGGGGTRPLTLSVCHCQSQSERFYFMSVQIQVVLDPPKKQQQTNKYYTKLPARLWTISLTIGLITWVLYKVSLSLLQALKSYPFFWNNSVVIARTFK